MPPALDPDASLAYERFLQRFPAYRETEDIDRLRARDFQRLHRASHVYLDYSGGCLYSEALVDRASKLLQRNLLGNPHSQNLASRQSTELVEQARERVLQFVGADPAEYCAIFTANASTAAKLVAEAFPFTPGSCFALTADNHNSISGITRFARRAGATVAPIAIDDALELDAAAFERALRGPWRGPNLLAYPAQSNYSGVLHSLSWLDRAAGLGWLTLLDAAGYAPTNKLDLSRHKPDFVCLSFYKMFGYPTGIGCLLAKRTSLAMLERPWFSGGTVIGNSFAAADHLLAPGEAAFEDGTVSYAGIPAVSLGLDLLDSIGIERIHLRVQLLTSWLLDELTSLRHRTERGVIYIHGPASAEGRGGTIAFDVRDPQGRRWDPRHLELLANDQHISLRTGNHCNPGANEKALRIDVDGLKGLYERKHTLSVDEFLWEQEAYVSGVARVSLGLVSDFSDVYRFSRFVRYFCDRTMEER